MVYRNGGIANVDIRKTRLEEILKKNKRKERKALLWNASSQTVLV